MTSFRLPLLEAGYRLAGCVPQSMIAMEVILLEPSRITTSLDNARCYDRNLPALVGRTAMISVRRKDINQELAVLLLI